MADVEIVIGASGQQAVATSDAVSASIRGIGTAAQQAGPRASASLRTVGDALAQVNRVANATSGSVGGIAEAVNGLAAGAKAGNAGLLLMASGGAAAAFALAKLSAAAVDTIQRVDELSESLSDSDRQRLAPYIGKLQAAKTSLDNLTDSTTLLRMELVSAFAPAVADTADALAGLVSAGSSVFEWASSQMQPGSVGYLLYQLSGTAQGLRALELLGSFGRAASADGPDKPARFGVPSMLEAADTTPEMLRAVGGAQRPQAASNRPTSVARPAAGASGASPVEEFYGVTYDELDLFQQAVNADAEERDAVARRFAEQTDKARQEYHDAEMRRIAEQRAAADAALADETQARQIAFGAAVGLLGQFAQIEGEIAADSANRTIGERRRAFKAQKAIMLAQAIVGAAAAIVEGFAQLGPIAGAVTAVTTGLATGIQIATISSTEPQFHVGMSPDEVSVGGARLLRSEGVGVFSPTAMDALGPQGVRDVVQTGRAPQAAQPIYVLLNGEEFTTRQIARPASRLGQR